MLAARLTASVSLLTAALLLLVFAAVACNAGPGSSSRARASDEWTRSHPAAAGARVEIVNRNGAIRAEATDGPDVELVAKRTASARDDEAARDLLAKLEMRETVSEGAVRVEVVHPSTPHSGNIEVEWTVRVPHGVSVDLRSENGSISLARLGAAVRARTANGAVTGTALASNRIDAKAVNGRVALELATPLTGAGSIVLSTVNGAVELRLPSESRATLSASVTNGSARAEGLDLAPTGARSRTRIEGTLGGGGTPVTLQTTNGSARIANATPASTPPSEPPAPSATPPAQDRARIADGAVSV